MEQQGRKLMKVIPPNIERMRPFRSKADVLDSVFVESRIQLLQRFKKESSFPQPIQNRV
jgi:hypothetical protein